VDKRYQVFVSSTFRDLQDERQEVMQALLELDCIPAGMELFPAANEDQWTLIRKVIDDCDYYIVVIGGRYGSIGPSGLSYTEMEYRYAVEQRKPVIAFLHKNPGSLPADRSEDSPEAKVKLQEFRKLAEQKMVKYWTTPSDLGSVVSRSLIMLIKNNPAVGWVKADRLPDESTVEEILRLRKRVEELEEQLRAASTQAPQGTESLSQGDDTFTIKFGFEGRSVKDFGRKRYSDSFGTSWNSIFSAISPLMMDEASEEALRAGINDFVRAQNIGQVSKLENVKGRILSGFEISNDDFQTIKVQLSALGLIVKSKRARSVKDDNTYWTLTPFGEQTMTQLRAIRKATTESDNAPAK
jgi:hypothetical protein